MVLTYFYITYNIGYRLIVKTLFMKTLPVNKAKSLKCAKQAQGTLNKVSEMIESDRYCPEIIQQVDSIIGLLKTAKRELLAGHLDTCVIHKMKRTSKKRLMSLSKYTISN